MGVVKYKKGRDEQKKIFNVFFNFDEFIVDIIA